MAVVTENGVFERRGTIDSACARRVSRTFETVLDEVDVWNWILARAFPVDGPRVAGDENEVRR